MVFNDIYPGFAWTQGFRFPAGTFAPGASVRADFKKHPAAPVLLSIGANAGVTRQGDDILISLTGAQTALLASVERVSFDFVRTPDETHLGIRVTVPVHASVTVPA